MRLGRGDGNSLKRCGFGLVRFLLERTFERPARRGRLDRSLAIGAFLAIAACLSPQDIEVDVAPVVVNVPPVFDPTKDVSPRDASSCVSTADKPLLEFRISNLRDGNGHEGQQLQARWFVDYDQNANSTAIAKSDTLHPFPDTDVYETARIDASFIHPAPSDSHVLEVVVSDRFDDNGSPKNRAIPATSYAVTYRWTFVYKGDAPCVVGQ